MRYRVCHPLLHDGSGYLLGDIVEGGIFTEEQTEHLIMTGTLVPIADEHPAPSEGQGLSGAPAETPSPASSARKGKGD